MEIIQHFPAPIPKIYEQCMNQVKSMLPVGVTYRVISEDENRVKNRMDSLFRRLEILNENPEAFVIDPDFLILKPFDFEFKKGKLYVFEGKCSAAAVYVNNCPEAIEDLIKKFKGRCFHNELNKMDTYKISEDYMMHLHLGALRQRNGGKNTECEIVKNDKNEYEFSWIRGFDGNLLR